MRFNDKKTSIVLIKHPCTVRYNWITQLTSAHCTSSQRQHTSEAHVRFVQNNITALKTPNKKQLQQI